MIAFTLIDQVSKKYLNDPQYIKWVVSVGNFTNLRQFDFQPCQEEQLKLFYPMNKQAQKSYLKAQQANSLLCLQDLKQMEVFGTYQQTDFYQNIKVQLLPCNTSVYKEPTKGEQVCNKTFDETMQYLGVPVLQIFTNQQSFDQDGFGEKTIRNYGEMLQQIFDPASPSFVSAAITKFELYDIDSYVQVGQQKKLYYSQLRLDHTLKISKFNNWPEDYEIFKFLIRLDIKVKQTTRKTYDILTWMGNVGGLLSSLQILGQIFVARISQNNANQFFTSKLFKFKNKKKKVSVFDYQSNTTSSHLQSAQNQQSQHLLTQLENDFKLRKVIPPYSLLTDCIETACCCLLSKKSKRRQFLVEKGTSFVDQELDIIQFIKTQRLFYVQMQTLMSMPQQNFVWLMSQQALDSDKCQSDSDAQDNNLNRTKIKFLSKDSLERSNPRTFERSMNRASNSLIKDFATNIQELNVVDQRILDLMRATYDDNCIQEENNLIGQDYIEMKPIRKIKKANNVRSQQKREGQKNAWRIDNEIKLS